MRKPFLDLYGFEEFKETWVQLVDYFQELKKANTTEKQLEIVRKIQAPTLIFHGEKDFYIDDVS
jgi:dipeptidyl aminopeptidase/acylaminoacyl peptidase